jgi:hypothetical protein
MQRRAYLLKDKAYVLTDPATKNVQAVGMQGGSSSYGP